MGGAALGRLAESRRDLHLIKLCVGVDSVEELATWQNGRLKELKKKKRRRF